MVLDVSHLTVITDYMVICTGRTAQQVHSLCDDVEDKLLEDGVAPRKKEGQNDGRWAILDYGPVLGFIGRNGAGKTTTLKSILGLVHPDAGEIRYFGLPFAQNEETKAFMP